MASLTETELVRARWRCRLRAEALDSTERDGFARRTHVRMMPDRHCASVA